MTTWAPHIATQALTSGTTNHEIFGPATMGLMQGVLRGTPAGVWALLAVLLAVGLSQLRTRRVGLARVMAFPLGMLGLSVWGVFGVFGAGLAAACWAATLGLLLPALGRLPLARHVSWDARARQFQVPGSAGPLVVILFIFALKYAVAVKLHFSPALAHDLGFAVPVAAAYGAVNALLAARTWALWRLTVEGRFQSSPTVTA